MAVDDLCSGTPLSHETLWRGTGQTSQELTDCPQKDSHAIARKANRCRVLLVDLLDCVEIDHSLAKAIFWNFNATNHPYSLRNALIGFFQSRPDKREEYRRAISGDNELGIPEYLTVLGTE